jgi:hypothetical protein
LFCRRLRTGWRLESGNWWKNCCDLLAALRTEFTFGSEWCSAMCAITRTRQFPHPVCRFVADLCLSVAITYVTIPFLPHYVFFRFPNGTAPSDANAAPQLIRLHCLRQQHMIQFRMPILSDRAAWTGQISVETLRPKQSMVRT